ncbi:hypothetical protein AB0M20_19715 [Actinoplanes sp. NPDC051633]|uniref:hypothetical protein n=1 Tax=Actinoplanes sp. NPDC051633 TaxID=3155670 RepID=UPI003424849C
MMAEDVREIKPPEPPPEPAEVPKPTELSNRSGAKAHGQPLESQLSAHQDAHDAAQSEYAKALDVGIQPGGGPPSEYNGPERRLHDAQHLDPAHDLRRQTPRPGDQDFDPGKHRGELHDAFRAGVHDPDRLFNVTEHRIADRLAEDGASVHPRERDDTVPGKKNPDAMVRNSPDDVGTITEFKTLKSADSSAVRRNILDAAEQVDQYGGGNVVIDGRGVNLTDESAGRGYARAVGQAKQMDLPMPERVEIIMGDGSIKVFPEERAYV